MSFNSENDVLKEVKNDDADAMFELAECYRDEGNIKQAFLWYRRAAEKGCIYAFEEVAKCYMHGIGVKLDFEQAFLWYKRAATEGLDDLCLEVGEFFERGIGGVEAILLRHFCGINAQKKPVAYMLM